MQLLSPESAADLFGRATPDEIANRMRADMALKTMAQNNVDAQAAQQQQAMAQAQGDVAALQEAKSERAREDSIVESERQRQHELAAIQERGFMQMMKDDNKTENKAKEL